MDGQQIRILLVRRCFLFDWFEFWYCHGPRLRTCMWIAGFLCLSEKKYIRTQYHTIIVSSWCDLTGLLVLSSSWPFACSTCTLESSSASSRASGWWGRAAPSSREIVSAMHGSREGRDCLGLLVPEEAAEGWLWNECPGRQRDCIG